MEHKINRDYIRGLFDGEGCVYLRPFQHSVQVTISNTNLEILEKIKEVLDAFLIRNKIIPRSKPQKKNWKQCYVLTIDDIWSAHSFWTFIGSCHKDKIKKFKKGFYKNEKLRRYLLTGKIKDWAKEGFSYKEISKRTKISRPSICKIVLGKTYKKKDSLLKLKRL